MSDQTCFSPATLSEKIMYATTRLVVEYESGAIGRGTGFFFNFKVDEERTVTTIVTNRHVIQDTVHGAAVRGEVSFHRVAPQDENASVIGGHITITVENLRARYTIHPNGYDLAVMPAQDLFNELNNHGFRPFQCTLDEDLIKTDEELKELSAVQPILMAGYPNGLWDEAHNFPLLRRGVTASHPMIDFNGRSTTVIDAACFPGSSGSPVLIADEGMYATKGAAKIGDRAVLLGVLASGPKMTVEGDIIVVEVPTVSVPKTTVDTMLHLGYIVKAKELLVLKNALFQAHSL